MGGVGARPACAGGEALGIGPENPNEERFRGFCFARGGRGGIEGDPAGGRGAAEVLGAVAIG
ncbi:MAG: hypothetical protein ACREXX_07245 [Gammaproteobacteria bacterium]